VEHAPDLDAPQIHDLDFALRKGSGFLRGIEALFHHPCHAAPPSQLLETFDPVRAQYKRLWFAPEHDERVPRRDPSGKVRQLGEFEALA
jgi:hypothetical protein